MGTWDVGPFDNDDAADFAGELDDAPPRARIDMVGAALERGADDFSPWDAPRAVAAAALVAAQYPGGRPVDPVHGPDSTMPPFPASFRDLAIEALDRVITTPTWLAEAWNASSRGPEWRRTVSGLRTVLDPPQRETLFEP
ncbi:MULTISPECIES: DUF4259 domain-containing protein [Catenuloplanes]|uniref:DUF4259 domain-containing protein n=1 Tax=Catenuloplanes niger TaxID=587534 RepID=A0AAE3ZHD6_9ACTN|nr:DUF4259 domain-containing protein [Catenuloplanes niger]MDR7319999.1 hypothetical protein [Catenuloplanes niger]